MTKLTKSLGCVAALFTASFFGAAASADAQTFDMSARGFYLSVGFNTDFDAYLTGWDGGIEYRSFFVFDIPELTEAAEGATISLWMPIGGYASSQSFETISLWSVETTVPELLEYHEFTPEGIAIFDDLGSGVSYGSGQVSATETGTYFTITLTAAGVEALNNSENGQLAIGASMTSGSGASTSMAFQNTSTGDGVDASGAQISVVPEPTTVALLGLSAGALLFFRKRSAAC